MIGLSAIFFFGVTFEIGRLGSAWLGDAFEGILFALLMGAFVLLGIGQRRRERIRENKNLSS